jgi:hypothetical protein
MSNSERGKKIGVRARGELNQDWKDATIYRYTRIESPVQQEKKRNK